MYCHEKRFYASRKNKLKFYLICVILLIDVENEVKAGCSRQWRDAPWRVKALLII